MLTNTFGADTVCGEPSISEDAFAASRIAIASGRGFAGFSIGSMLAWYSERLKTQRHRRELARLTDEQLRDIGLPRAVRDLEVSRSFWD